MKRFLFSETSYTELMFVPLNSTSVRMSWSSVSTSAVGSYRVMVQKLIHGGKVDEFALVEDKHEFVLTGLGEQILP